MPEEEKRLTFEPQIKPAFTADGKDKYYFDMKNNKEHYQMMTNDMTDEDFAVFEEREKARNDALHHSRKIIQRILDEREEKER